ncbi:hypothetical protein [Rhodanobacter sp. C05]|uniref:hypothetical protein n=1 Tax=Rhodanobacter sp. C05 TaxID=1945855 RepID=UPI00098566B6|nr:hypothetical protein [Rhodanobacter sp. C05]
MKRNSKTLSVFAIAGLFVYCAYAQAWQTSAPLWDRINVQATNQILLKSQLVRIDTNTPIPSLTTAKDETLGVVPVGVDAKGRVIGYRLVVALITPTPVDSTASATLNACASDFRGEVQDLGDLLDMYVQTSSNMLISLPGDITARNAEIKRREDTAIAATQSAFTLFEQRVARKLSVCYATKNMTVPAISIGLVSSPCTIGSMDCPAKGLEDAVRFQKIANLYDRAGRLEMLKDWTLVAPTGELGSFDAKLTLAPLKAQITLTPADLLGDLNRRVEQIRLSEKIAKNALIQPVVAALAGLSRNDIVRMADVLSSPNATVRMAWSKTDQATKISDALARVRLLECTRFQGKTTVKDIGTCAGYNLKIDDDKVLDDCLSGALCRPEFATNMKFDVALLAERVDLKKLATSADLPRIVNPNLTFSAYQKAAFECANANKQDKSGMMTCLIQAQYEDKKVKEVLGCAKNMVSGTTSADTDCLDVALGPQSKEAKMARCLLGAGLDLNQRMICAAQKSMDAKTAAAMDCVMNTKLVKLMSQCVSDPTINKLMKANECLDAGDRMAVALCLAEGATTDPNTVKAIDCLTKNGGAYTKGIACIALGNVKGDAGLILRCAASSGGDPRGTAICAVSPGLTPEQQIALSCAVTAATGPGYAACVGGQLSLKEFMNCQHSRFAEGPCFGDGNELRKFAKNVLGQNIGANSVVAQVVNVQLDSIKGTIALTEGILRGGSKLASDLGKGLSQAAQAANDLGNAAIGGLAAGVNAATPNITVGSSGVSVKTPGGSLRVGNGHFSVDVPSIVLVPGIHVGW